MCIVFIYLGNEEDDYSLIVAANRDEVLQRPTESAMYRGDNAIYGRDLRAGGTWMGVSTYGSFAFLNNVRYADKKIPNAPTRGNLVKDFLHSSHLISAHEYVKSLLYKEISKFNGFHLGIYDGKEFWVLPNFPHLDIVQHPPPIKLEQGRVYAVENGIFEENLGKCNLGKAVMADTIRLLGRREYEDDLIQYLLGLLYIPRHHPTSLPGVFSKESEVRLSSIHIRPFHFDEDGPYATRAHSVILVRKDKTVVFIEQSLENSEWKTSRFDIPSSSSKL